MTAANTSPTPSGIAAVDDRWGGLRPGSAALLVGRASTGRTALAMSAVRSAIEAGQSCLLLSPRATDALATAANATGVDLASLHKTGRLRVLRIPSAKDLAAKGNAGLDAAYRDLGNLAVQANAHRVVIEDFTPLVQYTTFEAFGNAFDTLRSALADAGAAFLLGLGEPANEPSKRLLKVVQDRVDATVRVSSGPSGQVVSMEESTPPAPQPQTTFIPETFGDVASAPPRPASPAPDPFAAPEAEPSSAPAADHALDALPDHANAYPSSDGASLPLDEPVEPEIPRAPLAPLDAPETEAPESPAFQETLTTSQPELSTTVLNAGIEIAPPPDPDLLAATSDPFGRDPGGDFFDNGYLVDSKGATTIPVTTVHQEAYPEVFTPPAHAEAPEAPVEMPSFSSLTAPAASSSDNGKETTRAALDAAFSSRSPENPFLVIAARMEGSQPESISFGTVIDGLRAALPEGASLYADASRLRSLIVIPGSDASGAQDVFSALQSYLQTHLGAQAEPTLQAVAAITVPDGQPFGSSEELWNYAVES